MIFRFLRGIVLRVEGCIRLRHSADRGWSAMHGNERILLPTLPFVTLDPLFNPFCGQLILTLFQLFRTGKFEKEMEYTKNEFGNFNFFLLATFNSNKMFNDLKMLFKTLILCICFALFYISVFSNTCLSKNHMNQYYKTF